MPFTPSGIKPWFWDENFPKTKLSTLLKTMMKEARNFTNHSLCVTGTTMLFDFGTPEAIIHKNTGHRSLSAYECMRELLLSNKQCFPISLPTPHLQRVNKLIQAKLIQHSIHLAAMKKLVQAMSGDEFDPDTSYSADDLEVFPNLAKMDI